MAYADREVATERQSLITDSARIIDGLTRVHERLIKLGDTLHGSEPRDASGAKIGAPEPAPTLRRNLDRSSHLLDSIENELGRIENRL